MASPTTTAQGPIAFDGAILATGPITGVGRAFLTTLEAYASHTDNRCVLLSPGGIDPPNLPGVEVVAGPTGRLRRQRLLPRILRRLDAQLLHCPVAAIPLAAPCPVIATVHDLPWMTEPPLVERGCGPLHRLAVHVAARRAAAIVVPTVATGDQLRRYAGDRLTAGLHVIHHGTVRPRRPAAAEDLCGPLLILADPRPRKNLARVRAAHHLAQAQTPQLPALQVIGPGHGYVPEDDKVALLRGARAVLVLSLHEGFGLPVIEAFAHGVPVLCSDIPSLREVAGDAALRVDPTDVTAIAGAMVRIHCDTAQRARLRLRGLQRAATLSPDSAAAGWQRLHREITL